MDEQKLRQQYAQTGNLLDAFEDSDFLQAMLEAEDACGGEIGAGFAAYSQQPLPVPPAQAKAVIREVRLQSMVLSELAELIQSVNLGAGSEAAVTEGRRRRVRVTFFGEKQITTDY